MLEFLHHTRPHLRTATTTPNQTPAAPRDADADQATEEGRATPAERGLPSALMYLMSFSGGMPANVFRLPCTGRTNRQPRSRRCRPRD